MNVVLGKGKPLNGSRKFVQVVDPKHKESVIAVALLGNTGLWDLSSDQHVRLRIPAATKAQRLRVLIWNGPAGEIKNFTKAVATVQSEGEAPDLLKLTQGGKAKWKETVETDIQPGLATGPYATDTFLLPDNNPWKSWMRLGGFDFQGQPARCSVHVAGRCVDRGRAGPAEGQTYLATGGRRHVSAAGPEDCG